MNKIKENPSQELSEETKKADDETCKCGDTKCVDGKLWVCRDIGQDTCIWFITDENCEN